MQLCPASSSHNSFFYTSIQYCSHVHTGVLYLQGAYPYVNCGVSLDHRRYIRFQRNPAFALQHCVAETVVARSVWGICWIYRTYAPNYGRRLDINGGRWMLNFCCTNIQMMLSTILHKHTNDVIKALKVYSATHYALGLLISKIPQNWANQCTFLQNQNKSIQSYVYLSNIVVQLAYYYTSAIQ
jgi:hypothetical protein